jgi:hypothetical protein
MHDDFREVRCLRCQVVFYLCRDDDRGQVYCGERCRVAARTEQKRAARAAHQASAEGRDDHRDAMRDLRVRRRVTDQGSRKVAPSATVRSDADTVSMDDTSQLRVLGDDDVDATGALVTRGSTEHVRCAVCGRLGRLVRFEFLAWHRRARHLARLAPRPP